MSSGARLIARTIPHILKSGATMWSMYATLGTYAPVRRRDVAKDKRGPYPWVPGDLVAEDARGPVAHVEHVPELGKGDRQECDRHNGWLIEPKPEVTQG